MCLVPESPYRLFLTRNPAGTLLSCRLKYMFPLLEAPSRLPRDSQNRTWMEPHSQKVQGSAGLTSASDQCPVSRELQLEPTAAWKTDRGNISSGAGDTGLCTSTGDWFQSLILELEENKNLKEGLHKDRHRDLVREGSHFSGSSRSREPEHVLVILERFLLSSQRFFFSLNWGRHHSDKDPVQRPKLNPFLCCFLSDVLSTAVTLTLIMDVETESQSLAVECRSDWSRTPGEIRPRSSYLAAYSFKASVLQTPHTWTQGRKVLTPGRNPSPNGQ